MAQDNNRSKSSGGVGIGGILLRSALILLCLILLCIHLMGNLYAKYATSGDGDDGARVANFDVDVVGAPEDLDIVCTEVAGDSGSYQITVTNNSEVAIQYDFTVVLSNTVPGVTVSLADYGGTVTKDGDLTYKFTNAGALGVGADPQDHFLQFLVDWNDFTEGPTGSSANAKFTFTVIVNVVQID